MSSPRLRNPTFILYGSFISPTLQETASNLEIALKVCLSMWSPLYVMASFVFFETQQHNALYRLRRNCQALITKNRAILRVEKVKRDLRLIGRCTKYHIITPDSPRARAFETVVQTGSLYESHPEIQKLCVQILKLILFRAPIYRKDFKELSPSPSKQLILQGLKQAMYNQSRQTILDNGMLTLSNLEHEVV